jgi:hypothetical protein
MANCETVNFLRRALLHGVDYNFAFLIRLTYHITLDLSKLRGFICFVIVCIRVLHNDDTIS